VLRELRPVGAAAKTWRITQMLNACDFGDASCVAGSANSSALAESKIFMAFAKSSEPFLKGWFSPGTVYFNTPKTCFLARRTVAGEISGSIF
jgi:hypothetical protein